MYSNFCLKKKCLCNYKYLDCVEGVIRNLDLEDGSVVVVEDVPAVEDAVLPHREEHGHPDRAPAAAIETSRGGLGPHDRRRLDVLTPNLCCRTSEDIVIINNTSDVHNN